MRSPGECEGLRCRAARSKPLTKGEPALVGPRCRAVRRTVGRMWCGQALPPARRTRTPHTLAHARSRGAHHHTLKIKRVYPSRRLGVRSRVHPKFRGMFLGWHGQRTRCPWEWATGNPHPRLRVAAAATASHPHATEFWIPPPESSAAGAPFVVQASRLHLPPGSAPDGVRNDPCRRFPRNATCVPGRRPFPRTLHNDSLQGPAGPASAGTKAWPHPLHSPPFVWSGRCVSFTRGHAQHPRGGRRPCRFERV